MTRLHAAPRRTTQSTGSRIATLALGLSCWTTSACVSTLPAPQLSASAVRLDVPLVRQDALYDCGLAAISALCHYWGVAIPEEERINLAIHADKSAGLSGADLRAALSRFGLESFLFQGSLDRTPTGIYHQIDAGRPPLVMLSADGMQHHYGLVLGYDEPRGNLLVLDPMRGETLVPVELFARNWERCRRFTLLASRKAEAPDVADPRVARGANPPSIAHEPRSFHFSSTKVNP